jgi:hypothetical protein
MNKDYGKNLFTTIVSRYSGFASSLLQELEDHIPQITELCTQDTHDVNKMSMKMVRR